MSESLSKELFDELTAKIKKYGGKPDAIAHGGNIVCIAQMDKLNPWQKKFFKKERFKDMTKKKPKGKKC